MENKKDKLKNKEKINYGYCISTSNSCHPISLGGISFRSGVSFERREKSVFQKHITRYARNDNDMLKPKFTERIS
jgi:hypothetical protein